MPVTINGTTGITTPAENTSALTVGAITGILKATSGVVSQAVAGTDYLNSSTGLQTSSFTGSNQLLSSSGYQKIPGGLIIQWGRVTSPASPGTLTFPIAFPTTCLSIVGTYLTASSRTDAFINFSSSTPITTSITYWGSSSSGSFNWIAIGY